MENSDTRTTDERRRRSAALRALAESGSTAAYEEALRVFGSERDLLLAAHQRWQVHLLARLDQALELGTGDPHEDVLRAVDEVGAVLPGLAGLLREHADDPVLAPARRRLAGYVAQACGCGRRHPLVAPAAKRPVRRARTAGAGVRSWLEHLRFAHCRHRPRVGLV